MRPWLLAILMVEVMTYANTQHDDFILDFRDSILYFYDAGYDAGYALTGEVVMVIDGDTFDLKYGLERHRVRLDGIDAPELDQAFGNYAKHYLLDLVESHTVRVEVRARDQSGIILGELFVNQLSINKLMLEDGYAWAIRGVRANRNWQGIEQMTRIKGIGLWRDKDAIPPW